MHSDMFRFVSSCLCLVSNAVHVCVCAQPICAVHAAIWLVWMPSCASTRWVLHFWLVSMLADGLWHVCSRYCVVCNALRVRAHPRCIHMAPAAVWHVWSPFHGSTRWVWQLLALLWCTDAIASVWVRKRTSCLSSLSQYWCVGSIFLMYLHANHIFL